VLAEASSAAGITANNISLYSNGNVGTSLSDFLNINHNVESLIIHAPNGSIFADIVGGDFQTSQISDLTYSPTGTVAFDVSGGGLTINSDIFDGIILDSLYLEALGNISIEDDINVGSGNVTLTSFGGAIDEPTGGSVITANNLTLSAVTGIGLTNPILTAVDPITATSVNGDININNTNALPTTGDFLILGTGNITFNQFGGGDLTVDSATTSAGNIDITATDSNLSATGVSAGGSGNATLTSDTGNVTLGSVTAGNTITVVAENNILAQVSGSSDNSLLTSPTVTLAAEGNIGSSAVNSALVTDSNLLTVLAGGDVNMDSTGTPGVAIDLFTLGLANLLTNNVILDSVLTFGNFTLEALTGNIKLNGPIDSFTGAVDLRADNGAINGPGTVTANADSLFSTPNGSIGTTDPVNVNIIGNLVLDIGGSLGLTSGVLTGTINAPAVGNLPLLLPSSFPSPLHPPGNVFYNSVRIWPTANEFFLSQTASGLLGNFVFPSTQQLALVQVNTFDPSTAVGQGGLFLYHPLIQFDSGAFDQEFQLDQGAFDFIDGEILKKGRLH